MERLLAVDRPPWALDAPDAGTASSDRIPDPRAEDDYERVPTRLDGQHVDDMLSSLDERERRIMRARYGLDGQPRTLRQLARQLGLSAERVRQIEAGAIDKLSQTVAGAPS